MSSDPQQKSGEQENDSSKQLLEHEAGCDILLKKEAVQLSSGDFESRKRLELLEGDCEDDDDDGDDENGDDEGDEDAPDDVAASAVTDAQSLMPGYSITDGDGDDDDDGASAYNVMLDYGDDNNELLSSGKDVTIVDTTGDALVRGTVCAQPEYCSANARRMDELWEEIGKDVYGMMQRVDLDDVVVNYNQHNFDLTGYADGRLVTVIQHPVFTVIAPFD